MSLHDSELAIQIKNFSNQSVVHKKGAYVNSEVLMLAFMCYVLDNKNIDPSKLNGNLVLDLVVAELERRHYLSEGREKTANDKNLFSSIEMANKTFLIVNMDLVYFPTLP